MIDAYIKQQRIDAPPGDEDPTEAPEPGLGADPVRELDLRAAGIRTVIWATGFGGDFDWLSTTMLNQSGTPAHTNGIGHSPGSYVLGFPWTSKRKSGIVYGIEEDATRIAAHVTTEAASSFEGARR